MTTTIRRQLRLAVTHGSPRGSGPYHSYASEADNQKAILTLLEAHPKVAWARRMNTGAMVIPELDREGKPVFTRRGKTKTRFVKFAFKGCSDVIGQLKAEYGGAFLAIEVKRWDGAASDEQLGFLHRVDTAGGCAGIARSVEDAQKIIEDFCALRKQKS